VFRSIIATPLESPRPGRWRVLAGREAWQGRAAMRISVSNWRTTEADIDQSADAILRSARIGAG